MVDGPRADWGNPRPPAPQADALHHVDRRHRVLHSQPTRGSSSTAARRLWSGSRPRWRIWLPCSSPISGCSQPRDGELSSPGHRRGDEVESVITTNPRTSW